MGLLFAGGAVFFGMRDGGGIDVANAIRSSNIEAKESGEGAPQVAVPGTSASLPNGGLVGTGKLGSPTPPPIVEEEDTSTSTDESVEAPSEAGDGEAADASTEESSEGVAENPEAENVSEPSS